MLETPLLSKKDWPVVAFVEISLLQQKIYPRHIALSGILIAAGYFSQP
jgi:hypothetical protein